MSDDLLRFEEKFSELVFLIERERYDKARSVLGELIRQDPEDPKLLFFSAVIEFQKDNYAEAEKALRNIFKRDPKNRDARELLFKVFVAQKRNAEAEAVIIELIREFPEEGDYYSLYAYLMLLTLHLDKAHRLACEAVRFEPGDRTSIFILALCDMVKNDEKGAGDKIAKLIVDYPEAEATSAALMTALIEKGKYPAALKLAQELLKKNPSNQDYVDIIKELKINTHITMLPLRPLIKYGWHASAAIWAFFILLSMATAKYLGNRAALWIVWTYIGLVLYSWFYPRILRRIMG